MTVKELVLVISTTLVAVGVLDTTILNGTPLMVLMNVVPTMSTVVEIRSIPAREVVVLTTPLFRFPGLVGSSVP